MYSVAVTMLSRYGVRGLLLSTLAAFSVFASSLAQAADTIKVGVLHSLSGTMAISETVLKDVTLMAIDEINAGGGAKRWVLLGTDYVYPRTTNKILRAFLHSKGVQDKDIDEKYTPFGHTDYQTIVADVKKFSAGGKTAVVSTINGDSNVPFYKELGNQGLKATDVPVVAFSVGEEELRGVDTKPLVGHLAAWNYFMSQKNAVNDEWKKKWAAYAKAKNLAGADKPLTNDPMEAAYVGMNMWKQAVEKAKSTDVDKVIAAMAGQSFKAPDGFTIKMDEKNHHLHKPVFIGEVQANGQFNVVWKTAGPIKATPWSPYIPEDKGKKDEPEKK